MARSGQGHPVITAALAKMAIRRQAEVGAVALDLFSADLAEAGIAPDVVVDACDRIGKQSRGEGETAFPDLGRILRECRMVLADREDARRHQLALEGAKFEERYDRYQRELSPAEAKAFMADFRRRVEAVRSARDEPSGLSLVKPQGAA